MGPVKVKAKKEKQRSVEGVMLFQKQKNYLEKKDRKKTKQK